MLDFLAGLTPLPSTYNSYILFESSGGSLKYFLFLTLVGLLLAMLLKTPEKGGA